MNYLICCSKKWFYLNCSNSLRNKKNTVFIFKKKQLSKKLLKNLNPRLIFFPHWSYIVPKSIYKKYLCIIFHTAPLPYGRGGSPIQNLIIRKFKNAPVCALKVSSDIDSGPIFIKKKISLNGSLDEILKRITNVIELMIFRLIKKIPIPKNQKGRIFKFKRINSSNSIINKNMNLNNLYDKIRMLDHDDYPRAFLQINNLKFVLSNVRKTKDSLFSNVSIKYYKKA